MYLTKIRPVGLTDFENNDDDDVPLSGHLYNPITGVVIVQSWRYSSDDGLERREGGRTSISATIYRYINSRYSPYIIIWFIDYCYIIIVISVDIVLKKKKKNNPKLWCAPLTSSRTRQHHFSPFRVFYPGVPLRVYNLRILIPLLVQYNLYKLLTPNYYYITSNYDVCVFLVARERSTTADIATPRRTTYIIYYTLI